MFPVKPQATGNMAGQSTPLDPELEAQAVARLRKLALAKPGALAPGKDAEAKQDRQDIMQTCFGVTGQKAFEALSLADLRAGWAKMQSWTREVPPVEEDVDDFGGEAGTEAGTETGADAGAADGGDQTVGHDHEADEEMDDTSLTAWLLEHLQEQARALGQERAFADFVEANTTDDDYVDGVLVLDEDARGLFMEALIEALPNLGATLPME
jgi:hypothetical protein